MYVAMKPLFKFPSSFPIDIGSNSYSISPRFRVVFSLIIINKAGGLIYQREFQAGLSKLSTNDYLVLAGTFHGYAVSFLFCTSFDLDHLAEVESHLNIKLVWLTIPRRVHAITRSLTPSIPSNPPTSAAGSSTSTPNLSTLPNPGLPKTGLEVLETERFRLTCFQTVTGTKFLLFTDPMMANVDVVK